MPCLALTPDADLALPMRQATGLDVVVDRVLIRLRARLGEWLSDTALGLPWVEWSNDQSPTASGAAALVRAQIEATTGVVTVNSCAASIRARTMTITAAASIVADGAAGDLTITATLDPFATTGAPAWYVVARPTIAPGGRW